MSTPPDIVHSVEIAIKGMSKFKTRFLSELEPTQKDALLEAFDGLLQHAEKEHNQEELVALCEAIYEVADAIPNVRRFLPSQQSRKLLSQKVSPELAREIKQKQIREDVRQKRSPGIRQGLRVITARDKNELLPRTDDETEENQPRSLRQIVEDFIRKITK